MSPDGALVLKMEYSKFSGLKSTVIIKLKIFRGNRHSYTLLMREQNHPSSYGREFAQNWQKHIRAVDWMFVPTPPHSDAEILTLKWWHLELGPLGGDKSKGWSPREWDQCLYKRDPREIPCLAFGFPRFQNSGNLMFFISLHGFAILLWQPDGTETICPLPQQLHFFF